MDLRDQQLVERDQRIAALEREIEALKQMVLTLKEQLEKSCTRSATTVGFIGARVVAGGRRGTAFSRARRDENRGPQATR